MKRLLLLLALLAPFAGAQSVVQCANNSGTTNTAITVTLSATSAGNAIVIMSGEGANNTSTVAITDSASQGSWNQIAAGYTTPNSTARSSMNYRTNSASITTVTATWSGSLSTTVTAVACEISGVTTGTGEDSSVNSNNNTSGTTATSGSLTTTNANDILIFAIRTGGNISACTAGSTYSIPTNATSVRVCLQTKTVSSTQSAVTTSMTWTTSQTYGSSFLALKASASATPAINKFKKLQRLDN